MLPVAKDGGAIVRSLAEAVPGSPGLLTGV